MKRINTIVLSAKGAPDKNCLWLHPVEGGRMELLYFSGSDWVDVESKFFNEDDYRLLQETLKKFDDLGELAFLQGNEAPNLHVGFADNIYTTEGFPDEEHITIRTSGGSADLSTGPAELIRIDGASIKQLVVNPTNPVTQDINTVPGHIYYVEVLAKSDTTVIGEFVSNITLEETKKWGYAYTRVTASKNVTKLTLDPAASIKYINIIDLTEHMLADTFTTAALAFAYCGKSSKPYGVNGVKMSDLTAISFNQFDSETMVSPGTLGPNGKITTSTTHSIICIPVIKGNVGVGENNGYRIHTSVENAVTRVGFSLFNITDPEFDSAYELDTPSAGYGYDYDYAPIDNGYMIIDVLNTAIPEAIVHLKWSYTDFVGMYNDYPDFEAFVLDIEVPELHGLFTYLDQAFLETKVLNRSVGITIYNGTEAWSYTAPEVDTSEGGTGETTKNGFFSIPLISEANIGLSNKYTTHPGVLGNLDDKVIRFTGSNLIVVDTEYTTVSAFQASLATNPLSVYHVIDTKVESVPESQGTIYLVDDFGIEIVHTDSGVYPSKLYIKYLNNLKDKLRNLPEDAISKTGDEVETIAEAIADLFGSVVALNKKDKRDLTLNSLNLFNFPTLGGCPFILTGTAAPSIAPDFIGQVFINTTSMTAYIACGTAESTSWKLISNT